MSERGAKVAMGMLKGLQDVQKVRGIMSPRNSQGPGPEAATKKKLDTYRPTEDTARTEMAFAERKAGSKKSKRSSKRSNARN